MSYKPCNYTYLEISLITERGNKRKTNNILRSDNEIAYRQKLEKKLKEINDSSLFKDKLSQQELESLKLQLNSVQGDYDELSNSKFQSY